MRWPRRGVRAVPVTTVLGTALLGASFATRPGSRAFYAATGATAAVWVAGSVAAGPGPRARQDGPGPVLAPVATGAGAFALFYAAALAIRAVPPLERAIGDALVFADEGEQRWVLATTLANGIGEEVFFRGALYGALAPTHPVLASTAVYTGATLATRNPALVLAAAAMGTVLGQQRRASGGFQAPLLTHATWSVLMVRFLPPLFRRRRAAGGQR